MYSAQQLVLHYGQVAHTRADQHRRVWVCLNLQPSDDRSIASAALIEQLGAQILRECNIAR
jgi:hypothetical protein